MHYYLSVIKFTTSILVINEKTKELNKIKNSFYRIYALVNKFLID